jgi:hypothetical protein
MNIAYIVLAHKLPHQLVRLVRRLSTPSSSFLVHIDRKSPEGVFEVAHEALAGDPAVRFLKRRMILWSGFGHVEATIDGIDALETLDSRIDYAILMTGQDYPTKPTAEIESFLGGAGGRSFLEYFPLPWRHWAVEGGGYDRLRYPYLQLGRRILRVPMRRRLPRWLTPFGGAAYWVLSRPCLDYVRGFVRDNPRFVRFFRTVRCPDELFFQTILLNSPLTESLVNDYLWFTEWNPASSNPNVLTEQHIDTLAGSSKLFARKFDTTVDEAILDLIDHSTAP